MSLYYRACLTLSYVSLEETPAQGTSAGPEIQRRGPPRTESTIRTNQEGVHDEAGLLNLAGPEMQPQRRGRPRKAISAPASSSVQHDEAELRQRGRPRKAISAPASSSPVQRDEAELLESSRQDLVDTRVQFEDDRWLQNLRDSDSRAWCKPVTRDLQLETVQSFYKAMYDETTMEIRYCVVCGLQKASIDLGNYIWEDFLPLYLQVQHLLHPSEQDHFECRQCFPRNNGSIPICHGCEDALQRKRIPRACQVNMLQLKCQHRYPKELMDLSHWKNV